MSLSEEAINSNIISNATAAAAASADDNAWLSEYIPLDARQVNANVEAYRHLDVALQHEWDMECSKYEQFISGTDVPNRNYVNADGMVRDPALYPYHTSMYPLLDCFDFDKSEMWKKNGIVPCSLIPPQERTYRVYDEDDVDGTLPVSIQTLAQTLLQPNFHCCNVVTFYYLVQAALDQNQELFTLLKPDDDHDTSWPSIMNPIILDSHPEEAWIDLDRYGHLHLFNDNNPHERTRVLLNLLQHALSELQRDYRLASAVATLLCRTHVFDSVRVLERFLLICCQHYVPCDGACAPNDNDEDDEPQTHVCRERQYLDRTLPQVLAFGMKHVTNELVVAMTAFCRFTVEREFGHVIKPKAANAHEERTRQLKRTVFMNRIDANSDGDAESGKKSKKAVPIALVNTVVYCLGVRGTLERRRLLSTTATGSLVGATNNAKMSLDSYLNCLRGLVDIGEAYMLYLPNSERFYTLASGVVRNIASLLADTENPIVQPVDQDSDSDNDSEEESCNYVGFNDPKLHDKRLICYNRFADCITDATRREKAYRALTNNTQNDLCTLVTAACAGRPHPDIRDVVRGLFVRDSVDVREAGFGYSDFLLWCRFEYDICLDPVIFFYDFAIPVEPESDSDDSSDDSSTDESDSSASGEERVMYWETDEENHVLTRGEQRARYDFSLMLLLKAWRAPWTAGSHLSFQPAFRDAARCVMLCAHRRRMPNEVGLRIVEFLGRDFWPDDRDQCWNSECQMTQLKKRFMQKRLERHSNNTVRDVPLAIAIQTCPICNIPRYCSKKCKTQDSKARHKRVCNAPLYPRLLAEEDFLISAVAEESPEQVAIMPTNSQQSNALSGDEIRDDDNDEDWIDVESDEESEGTSTRTRRIYRFFKDNFYSVCDITE